MFLLRKSNLLYICVQAEKENANKDSNENSEENKQEEEKSNGSDESDPGDAIIKEEMARKRKRGVHLNENEGEEEEAHENDDNNVRLKWQQKNNTKPSSNQDMNCKKQYRNKK